jgi:subtilisin family serine protease
MLALLPLALAEDSFFPGRGPESVRYGDLLAAGSVLGRTGHVLVRAEPGALDSAPGIRRVTTKRGGLLRVEPADGDDLALARALRARPGVAWTMPDLILPLVPAAAPDDPLLGDQWHLENTGQGGRPLDVDIDATVAWEYATGAGQRIAILDSGTQLDHPDLRVIPGYDYVDRDDVPDPGDDTSNAHGTGTAGIAAAIGNNGYGVAGVAWDAEVYAIRLIGGATSTEDLYDAFYEAVDAGATVLSNSWGFNSDCSGVPDYAVFDDIFAYAEDVGRDGLGAAVVFAAGNAGCDIDADSMLRHRTIVVVSAIEAWDERAWYSNYGEVVDIGAPTALLTADVSPGGYGSYGGDDAIADGFSGTSGATPVVAGVMALMFEANPRLTARQARSVLCDTAVRMDLQGGEWDADGWSPYYGCGRIDAGAAVAAVANSAPAAPVPRLVSETAELPRVLLAWEPALDADGDVQSYTVRWSLPGDDEPRESVVTETTIDLSEDLEEGDVVTWTVSATDPWGEGPESAPLTFTVVAAPVEAPPADEPRPESPSTCAASPTGGALTVALAALLIRRRRR